MDDGRRSSLAPATEMSAIPRATGRRFVNTLTIVSGCETSRRISRAPCQYRAHVAEPPQTRGAWLASPNAGVPPTSVRARHIGQTHGCLRLSSQRGAGARLAGAHRHSRCRRSPIRCAVFQKLFGQGDTDKERATIPVETGSISRSRQGHNGSLAGQPWVSDRGVRERLPGIRSARSRAPCADGPRKQDHRLG